MSDAMKDVEGRDDARDPGTRYVVHIDKKEYETTDPTVTGKELLKLAGKTPIDQFAIYLRVAGSQPRRLGPHDHIDLREPGIERFVTLPLDQTEG